MLQKSGLERHLLDSYHSTMKETVRGIKLAAILITIENLQLALLMFVSEESQVRQLLQPISWLLDSLSVVIPIKNSEAAENVFLIVATLTLLLLAVLHTVCLYKPNMAKPLRYFGDGFQYILAVPMISSLVYILFKNMRTFNVVKLLASALLLLLIVGCYVMLELLLVVFDLGSEDAMSRNPKSRYYLKPLLMGLVSLAYAINQAQLFEQSFDVLICCLLVFYVISLYDSVVEMIDYNTQLTRYKLCLLLLLLSLTVWDGIAYNISIDLIRQNYIGIALVFYGFVVVLLLNYRNYTIKNLLAEPIENIHNPHEFHIKLRANYKLLLDCKKQKSNMLRSAVIRSHTADCTNPQCLCRCRESLYDPATRQWSNMDVAPHNDPTYCKFFLKMLLEEGRSKFRQSRLIELTWLYLKWNLLKLYQQLFHEINLYGSMFERQLNIGDKYLLHHLRREMHEYLQMRNINNATHLMIEDIEKFDLCYEKLRQEINQSVDIHEAFWKIMTENVVDRPSLLKHSDDLANRKTEIQRLYQQTVQYNPKSTALLVCMYQYCSKVIFDGKLAKKVRKSITLQSSSTRQSNYEFPQEFRGDNKTATLKVSVEEEDMGRVLWVSNQFELLFGYPKKQVIGSSLNKLMPALYVPHHDTWIRQWKQRGSELNMNTIRHIFVLNKQANLCSCDGFIKIIPCFDHFQMIGMLRKNNEKDYILVNEQCGRIEATGSTFTTEILGVSPQVFQKERVEIQIFSPELLAIFSEPDKIVNRTAAVHFLVPKNIKPYIQSFSAEKHFVEGRRSSRTQQQPKQPKPTTLRYQLYDLVTDTDRLQRIMYANIRIEKAQHHHSKEKISYFVLKILEVTQVGEVPTSLKHLQDQVREETYQRIASLKEFRKSRQQQAIEMFTKILQEKRADSQTCSRVSGGSIRRKQITVVPGRSSIASINGSYRQHDAKRTKAGQHSPRRLNFERIVDKIKDALYRAEVIGRTRFSVFFDRKKSAQPKYVSIPTSGMGTKDYITQQKSFDLDSYYVQKDRDESETFKQQDQQAQVHSGISTGTNATADMDYEELKKRQTSKQEHSSLKKYKVGLLLVCFLYLATRIVGAVVVTQTLPQVGLSYVGYAEACQVMMLTELDYHATLLYVLDKLEPQPINLDDIARTGRSTNLHLSQMIQSHLQTFAMDILGHPYNKELIIQTYLDVSRNLSAVTDALKLIRMTQVETQDTLDDAGEDSTTVPFLRRAYVKIQQVNDELHARYTEDIDALLNVLRICQIVRSTLHVVLYIVLMVLTSKQLSTSENWIRECLDTMASTSMEMAVGCYKYYRNLRQEKSLSECDIQVDLEDFLQSQQNCRTPHAKGQLNNWYRYPLLLVVVLCSFTELTAITQYNRTASMKTTPHLIGFMYKGFSTLSEPFIKLKEDIYYGGAELDGFYEIFPKDYTYFVNYTQAAFAALKGTDYYDQLLNVLRLSVCDNFGSRPINVSYSNCAKDPATPFGLVMQAQSLAMYLNNTYTKIAADPSVGRTSIQLHHQFGLFYFFNGWTTTWHILQKNLEKQMEEALATNVKMQILELVVFVGLAMLLFWVYANSVRGVNRISAYILIIPRRILQDNQYAKRYLRRFL